MKIVAMGDTHGRPKWRDIVIQEQQAGADKFIFIGDYFDARDGGYSANRQIENFKDILAFKQANMNSVVLLTGNHDYHYILAMDEQYSGYQDRYVKEISAVLEPAIAEGLLQMCYWDGKFLFTHAGLTKTWAEKWVGNTTISQPMVDAINDLLINNPAAFKFAWGPNGSHSGDDVTQSPIWVRTGSLLEDMVDNVICVVGHTPVNGVQITSRIPNLIMIDCLGTTYEYLVIEDGMPKISRTRLGK